MSLAASCSWGRPTVCVVRVWNTDLVHVDGCVHQVALVLTMQYYPAVCTIMLERISC